MSEVITEPSKLELVIQSSGLADDSALAIRSGFSPFFSQAVEWQAKIASVTDPKVARASRLVLKNIRVEAKHKKEELKETVLKVGRAIDGAYKTIEDTIAPMETQLEAVEKAAERAEQERKAKIKAEREALLAPYGVNTAFYQLAEMPAETFTQLLEGSRAAHDAKLAAAAKAEADRIAKAQAEAAERERVKAENERLKKEAFEQEQRLQKERAEAAAKEEKLRREREQAEEATRKQKAELEAKAKAERDALEAKARAERASVEEQSRKEREAREKAERELANTKAAEAAKLAAEENARKKAARAPDREKVKAFARTVRALAVPQLTTEEGKQVEAQIIDQMQKFAAWLDKKGGEL